MGLMEIRGKIYASVIVAMLLAGIVYNTAMAEESETKTTAVAVNSGVVNVYDAEKVFSADPYNSDAEPEVEIGSGTITEANGEYEYEYTAPIGGRYCVKLKDVNANCNLHGYVIDNLGNTVGELWAQNGGDEQMVQFETGKTYTIKVRRFDKDTSFKVSIIAQKEPLDISELSEVKDQISFAYQINVYYFTPKVDGYYRFEYSDMTANLQLRIFMWDPYDTNICESLIYEAGVGDTIELEADATYEIVVSPFEGLGEYTLYVYQQKEMVDVTGYTEINDSMEMKEQVTSYQFVAPEAGTYVFGLANLKAQLGVRMILTDQDTNQNLAYHDWEFQDGIYLEKGQKCVLDAKQSSGFGNYTINITYPEAAYDFLRKFEPGSAKEEPAAENSNGEETTTEGETEDPEINRLKEENDTMKSELSEMQKQYEELRQLMSENGIISDGDDSEGETETETET